MLIGEIVGRVSQEVPALLKMSQKELPALTRGDDGSTTISIYSGTIEPGVILESVNRLKVAFPQMDDLFFNLLAERIVSNGFSNERLKDAVNRLIDNHKYKEIKISDIIAYDKKVRLYRYREVVSMVCRYEASFDDFDTREIDGKVYWIMKEL